MLHQIFIMGVSLYDILFYFFIFSFLGWLMETCLCSITEKQVVNRGFLNGPLCPIYGFGMSLIILFLDGFKDNLLLLFLGGLLFATILEYLVGMLLEGLFNAKWWDYSDKPMNIQGRVCVPISLCWGALCVVMIRWVVPFVNNVIDRLDTLWGTVILGFLVVSTALDTIVTVYHMYGLNRIIDELSRIKGDFKKQLENTDLYTKTEDFRSRYGDISFENYLPKAGVENYRALSEKWKTRLDQMAEEIKNDPKMKEFTDNVTNIRQRYTERLNNYNFVQKRILKAFPNFRHNKNHQSLKELKEKIKPKRKKDE